MSKFHFSTTQFLKFFIPSLIGILLFMTPIPNENGFSIPVAVLSKKIGEWTNEYLSILITFCVILTVILTLVVKLFQPKIVLENKFIKELLDVSWIWVIIRFLGGIFIIMTFFQVGLEEVYSENTGGLLLHDLMPILFVVFFLAGLLLPLVLDFGLLEFFGMLLSKIMRPLFSLPGRSSVDCITSWLGDGTIGVLLTNKQYEEGFYSKREAAVIATSFSAVSITFCLVVISQVKLDHLFLPMIGTVALAGIICAIIIPKIPPLSRISDTYYKKNEQHTEMIPEGETPFSFGVKKAVERADASSDFKKFITDGIKNILDMWMGVLPIVMAMGTIALIIAEYTPIFEYLGMPFIPLLELLQIPEAEAMSKTIMVGFADMFLPSVIGASIESDLTRFVIACLSVSQLIYMSEVGGLILGTKIPVNIGQLLIIFLLRTLISLPIITFVAHMIF
ncbi:uncharacterized protein UJ101_01768 [Flavobacteriaceae bacterium UJ101]|nr:uncharacterized protein UJ101_01768 [Flavobacteriaceae bacterium UJ101]